MKRQLFAMGVALAAALPAQAADVGVSISVSQPGVYGRIDIGRFPQPQVVMAQPVLIERPAVVVARPQPVYMWVPPGHQKNWRKHCHKYNACGTPVYFVQENWYQQHVMAPAHQAQGHEGQGHGHKQEHKGKGKGKGKHDD